MIISVREHAISPLILGTTLEKESRALSYVNDFGMTEYMVNCCSALIVGKDLKIDSF